MRYPELKDELAKVEEAQERFLLNAAVKPPAHLKLAIMEQLDQEEESSQEAPVVPIVQASNFWKYAAAACVAVAVMSSYMAYNYYGKYQETRSDLKNMIARNAQIAKDYNVVNQKLQSITTEMDVMGDPEYARVLMKGTETSPEALASVYWNTTTNEVYVSIHNLQQLTQDKQYQLWAIVDGKPVDAGVFDNHNGGLIKMKNIPKAAAFAVTIEPRGGSVNPTLTSMQVMGNT